jgi:hypothetical protein
MDGTTTMIILCCFFCLCLSSVFAYIYIAYDPDFTGTWKLNKSVKNIADILVIYKSAINPEYGYYVDMRSMDKTPLASFNNDPKVNPTGAVGTQLQSAQLILVNAKKEPTLVFTKTSPTTIQSVQGSNTYIWTKQ